MMNTLHVAETSQPPPLPPQEEINAFKSKVKQWIGIDEEISKLESRIRDLRKLRNKQLEPEITGFMRQFNISDINTDSGKIRCNARNTKECLNKTNIRDNLSQVLTNPQDIDKAMECILQNRPTVTRYKLTKPKPKKK